VAEKALSCARAVPDGGPRTAADDGASRELAERRSGPVEVRLLWHPVGDWVELCLRDLALGTGFRVVVAPGRALDAFYHPYAYEPGSDAAYADRDETAVDDG
jgi:hypothetical protein